MRAVVQRVSSARVEVGGTTIAAIEEPGLVVLLAVTHDDDAGVAARMALKIHELRILRGERSAAEAGAPLLVVSQFTLYADTGKGRRPSWSAAAPAQVAEPVVEEFVRTLREHGAAVATGAFGADMSVHLVNDGPVTLVIDS